MIRTKIKPDSFDRRTALVTVFLLLAFAGVTLKLFFLQVVNGKEARLLAQDQHSIFATLSAARGEIKITDKFSKEPIVVAGNVEKPLVYAVPSEVSEPLQTAIKLASVLSMDEKEILQRFEDKSRKYVPIKRQISKEQEEAIKRLKLPGISFDYENVRVYPQGRLLAQVLGYVGYKDTHKEGLYGLEKYFEKDLAGTDGSLKQETGAKGAWVFGSTRDIVSPKDGANLILTIDKSIQFKAESVLRETVEKHGADSGSIIVVNPKTGEVLAMAGFPDFNPNEYNKEENPRVFVNQPTLGAYEPGSVFKALTMAAAINEGKITPDTTYTDTGSVEIDGYTIKNSDLKAHGVQTMTQVLEESLNTGAIFAKEQIGNEKFYEYLKNWGFGKMTDVELLESRGSLENLKAKINVNFHTASFGQGITATPIQLIQAFTSLANRGKMMRPYLVKDVVSSDGSVKENKPQEIGQIISAKTADTVSAMMVNVVENGHGKRAGVKGYYIAGKTGTAQIPKKDGKGYETDTTIGTFIGYGPVDDPKFLMLVRVDRPKDVIFAESTAAPAFGQIAEFILNYYNIPPSRTEEK